MEPMAAALAPGNTKAKHQSLQQFIADAPWRDAPVMRAARDYALPALMAHGGVEATLVDDTGIPKQGKNSVGVARQYCGQLGKVCNCQVAVSLSLVNQWASLPIAYDLYLPEEWANDPKRRKQTGIPAEIEFRTKPQIALGQIPRAKKSGGDARQTNQFDQRLRSGINAAADALSHRPGGTLCEVISIFLI
jgi:SRSO17 transposase